MTNLHEDALLKVSSRKYFEGIAELSIYVDHDNKGKGLGIILNNI